jgi:uncharacterized membrane protein YcaP (DUF421 family)
MEYSNVQDTVKRVLFGEAPPIFLIEVFTRTLIVYVILIIVVRLLGKRMAGRLTQNEMAVFIAMGAIVSVPMQDPERGLVVGLVVLISALCFQRGINWLTFKNRSLETVVQGTSTMLVKNGIIQLENLKRVQISRQQLFAMLRSEGVLKLSKVKRLYLEACGVMSVFPEEMEKPGLPLLPVGDEKILEEQRRAKGHYACEKCGNIEGQNTGTCGICGSRQWTIATF